VKKTMRFVARLWVGMALCVAFAQGDGVKVNVPFQFWVAGKTLPAGVYVFSARRDRMLVRNAEGDAAAMALVGNVSGGATHRNGDIVFRCYGSQCFLSQLWNPTEDGGHQLVKSHEEEQAAKREPGAYFAVMGVPSPR
jgi:hypothetical protein